MIVELVTKQAMVSLAVAAPYTQLPVLSFIIEKSLAFVVGFILDYTLLGANLVYVVGETTYDLYAFKRALAEYAEAKKDGITGEELNKFEKQIIKKGFELIDLNGIRF